MAETEKKKASWSLAEGSSTLAVTYPDGREVWFDMVRIYPEFLTLTDTVQQTLCYGAKQKMGDSCARPKDEKLTQDETIKQMNLTFDEIVSGEAWTKKKGGGVRVDKTEKQITDNMKLLTPAEQDAFKASLAKMGMMLKG